MTGAGLLFVLVSTELSRAEPQPDDLTRLLESEPVVTLTLAEAVIKGLDHNLDIDVSRRERDVRITDIVFEQAKFDPTVTLSGRFDRSVAPLNRPIFGFGGTTAGGEPDKFDQSDANWKLGMTQKLLSGATYDLTYDTTRNSVAGPNSFLFNPSYASNFLLNLTQPLLRNYGTDVAHVQINIAKNAAARERYVFVGRVMDIIAQIEEAYWELVFARQNADVAKAALKAAQELLASNQAKAQAGVLPHVDVLQAQAGVASRVEGVLIAQKAIRDQEDKLRQLFTDSEESLRSSLVIVPLDVPSELKDMTVVTQALDTALTQRPEILQAKKNVDSSQLNAQFAKNQLLPSLDFQGTMGLSGLGQDPSDSYDRAVGRDFYNIGAGMVLSYPLGNRSAESQFRRRQLEVDQANARFLNTRRQIIVDVKEAIRRVQTNFKRIETTKVARQFAERQVAAEQERLNVGLGTTRAVLDAQRDFATARGNALRAVVDYNQALSNLRRATAVSFEHYGVTFQ